MAVELGDALATWRRRKRVRFDGRHRGGGGGAATAVHSFRIERILCCWWGWCSIDVFVCMFVRVVGV